MSKKISVTHLVDPILHANKHQNLTNKKPERGSWVGFVSITVKPTCWRKQSLFLPLPALSHPSISKVFWELTLIAQSTNVENHKDVLIGKKKKKLLTASLGYLGPNSKAVQFI